MNEVDINLFLIRHAESAMNVQPHLIGGRSNEALLTERGVAQAQHLGQYLLRHNITPQGIYVSPAVRTQQTAQYCLRAMGIEPAFITCEEIQELDQGEWVGQPRAEIYTADMLVEINRQGLDFKAPGGESMREVADRMERWAHVHFDEYEPANPPENHLVFTHGVAIRSWAGRFLGWTNRQIFEASTDNTSVTLLTRRNYAWQLEYLGHVPDQPLPAMQSA